MFKEKIEQIQMMELELEEARASAYKEARDEVQSIIDLFGLQASDFRFHDSARKHRISIPRGPVAPKYAGPNGETWSGRGRTPLWIVEHEENGGSRDDFLI